MKRIAIGILATIVVIAGLGYWASSELNRIDDERLLADQARNEVWVAEQKHKLESGEQEYLYFYSTSKTDELIVEFLGMPEIENLAFEMTDLSNDGFRNVVALPNLQELMIYGGLPRIGDPGIELLRNHKTLRKLKLINVDVTDSGLDVLQSLPHLTELELYRESFRDVTLTDAALEHLSKLKNLSRLTISGGWMSDAAILELRDALPDCEIGTASTLWD